MKEGAKRKGYNVTNLMKAFVATCVASCGVLLGGCAGTGPSIAPFYVMRSVETEPKFVGVWEPVAEKDASESLDLPAVFTVTDSERFGYDVHVRMNEPASEGAVIPDLFVTVFRVGQYRYLNITLGLEETEKLGETVGAFVITTHYMMKFEIDDDEVRLLGRKPEINLFGFGTKPEGQSKPFNYPSINLLDGNEELLKESGQNAIKLLDASMRVINVSSPELQRVIVEAEAAGEFKDVLIRLRRVKRDVSQPIQRAEEIAEPKRP